MNADIERRIAEFIHLNFVFDGSSVAADASLTESGLVDSAGMLEVLLFIEEEFGITVDDEDVLTGETDSIAQLTGYVRRKLGDVPQMAAGD